jgi:hypothetical protein
MENDNKSVLLGNDSLEASKTTKKTSVSNTNNQGSNKKKISYETSRHTIRWQNKLLPWMLRLLIGMTIFFFIVTSIQIIYIGFKIEQVPEFDMPSLQQTMDQLQTSSDVNKVDAARWKTLAMLEENSLRRRYHQASVLLMSRTWTRYLGFVTGMILALVGGIFILGKLQEPESKAEGESPALKFSISSASPGLILAFLGTVLMVTTMITPFELGLEDKPAYLSTFAASSDQPAMLSGQIELQNLSEEKLKELQNLSEEELEKRSKEKLDQMNSPTR